MSAEFRDRQRPERSGFSVAVWDLFRAVRMTVILLAVLALVAIAGTVVPQGAAAQTYELVFGSVGALIVRVLGLDDAYHSTWFLMLLTFLGLNLLACTWDRLPAVLRRFRTAGAEPMRGPGQVQAEIAGAEAPAETTLEQLAAVLGRSWRRPHRFRDGEQACLAADRGRAGHLAFPLTHVSLLLILVGGLVSGLFAVEGDLTLTEGESADRFHARVGTAGRVVRELGFEVRCDEVRATRDSATGRTVQYSTRLVVLRGGQEAARARIEVNTPLRFGGWTLYQSNYDERSGPGGEPRRITGLRVAADPGTEIVWAGCGLLVVGLFLALLVRPARLRVEVGGGVIRMHLSGKGGRESLEEELQELKTKVAQGLRGSLGG